MQLGLKFVVFLKVMHLSAQEIISSVIRMFIQIIAGFIEVSIVGHVRRERLVLGKAVFANVFVSTRLGRRIQVQSVVVNLLRKLQIVEIQEVRQEQNIVLFVVGCR